MTEYARMQFDMEKTFQTIVGDVLKSIDEFPDKLQLNFIDGSSLTLESEIVSELKDIVANRPEKLQELAESWKRFNER
jgi:hypothetical protein